MRGEITAEHRHWSQQSYRARTTEEWSAIQADTHDDLYANGLPFGSKDLKFTVEQALYWEDYAFKRGRRCDRGDRTKRFLELLDLPALEGKRVLDVGCGFGQYAVLCAKMGAHVTGVELSPVGIARANAIAAANAVDQRCRFIAGDFLTQDLPGGAFDVVYLNEVFQNLIKYPGLKEKLRRIAKPGARILIADTLRGGAPVDLGRRLVKYLRHRGRPDLKQWEENTGGVPLVRQDFEEFARGFPASRLELRNYFFMVKQMDFLKKRQHRLAVRVFLRAAHWMDRAILAVFPFMRRHCSEAILVLEN